MRKSGFFPRLALVNIARNSRFYLPYLLSCGGVAAMYYILQFLEHNEGLDSVRGAMYLKSFASVGCFIAAMFSAVILLYAKGFTTFLGWKSVISPRCASGSPSSAR